MSAYLVEDKTINLIAGLYCYGLQSKYTQPIEPRSLRKPSKIAIELKRMNLKALEARYPSDWNFLTQHQGITEIDVVDSDGNMAPAFEVSDEEHGDDSLAQKLKHVQCFLYQCSEGNISDTELFKSVEQIKDDLKDMIINELPAYRQASWE